MTNCPNCGAPIKSNVCEYCGTVFSKPKSIVFYNDTTAYCTAEGWLTTATGDYSHAEGRYTIASGDMSHAGANPNKKNTRAERRIIMSAKSIHNLTLVECITRLNELTEIIDKLNNQLNSMTEYMVNHYSEDDYITEKFNSISETANTYMKLIDYYSCQWNQYNDAAIRLQKHREILRGEGF